MYHIKTNLVEEEVRHFLPQISPSQKSCALSHVLLMEARIPLRNLSERDPGGSMTPSRPSVSKGCVRRTHSAGKLRKSPHSVHELEQGIYGQPEKIVNCSPLSVSDFCVSPTIKRPLGGRRHIVSRSENSHLNKSIGIEPKPPPHLTHRNHLFKELDEAITCFEVLPSKEQSFHSPPISPRRIGFERDEHQSDDSSHWYSQKKSQNRVEKGDLFEQNSCQQEVRNLFEQFDMNETDVEKVDEELRTEACELKPHLDNYCDNIELSTTIRSPKISHTESPSLADESEPTCMQQEAWIAPREYNWEPMIKSAVPCRRNEMPSFTPTLQSVSETSVLELTFVNTLLRNSLTTQTLPEDQKVKVSSNVESRKNKKSNSGLSICTRKSDTYGAWMQKQVGVSNKNSVFFHVFEELKRGNFHEVEAELKQLETAHSEWQTSSSEVIDLPRDDFDNTLLMSACHSGSKRAVRWCLAQGADVDKQNKFGNTCLHFAIEFGLKRIADHLKNKQQANTKITNKLNLSCFQRVTEDETVGATPQR